VSVCVVGGRKKKKGEREGDIEKNKKRIRK
jgi:hypothetical protein